MHVTEQQTSKSPTSTIPVLFPGVFLGLFSVCFFPTLTLFGTLSWCRPIQTVVQVVVNLYVVLVCRYRCLLRGQVIRQSHLPSEVCAMILATQGPIFKEQYQIGATKVTIALSLVALSV